MAEKYLLQVTAGSSYDPADHQIVPVNEAEPITIDTEHITADLNVRIKSYRGLPLFSPSSSAYFSLPDHAKNDDKYSISFAFTLKSTINGNDLIFGNDFDYPIRDRLPLGFGTAFRIVKWMIDPGLDGDVYADQPYLYGPVASSFNILYVGDKGARNRRKKIDEEAGLLFSEGGSENGIALRKEKGVPDGEGARKKYFLNELNRKAWDWEAGREYGLDFFNPYLDFNDFALRLPGFTLSMINYWDGQALRYTLKNRATNTILLVVVITLTLKEDVDQHGAIKKKNTYSPHSGLSEKSDFRCEVKKSDGNESAAQVVRLLTHPDDDVD